MMKSRYRGGGTRTLARVIKKTEIEEEVRGTALGQSERPGKPSVTAELERRGRQALPGLLDGLEAHAILHLYIKDSDIELKPAAMASL